jgi:predicted dehydrogenase
LSPTPAFGPARRSFDLARLLLGEGEVVGAAAARHDRPECPDADVDDVSASIVRFASGAIGSFTTTCLLASGAVEFDLVSEGLRQTIRLVGDGPGPRWAVTVDDGSGDPGGRTIPVERDPYEVQSQAFLDAVEASDPSLVLSSYADAMRTDALTRSVVSAAGAASVARAVDQGSPATV